MRFFRTFYSSLREADCLWDFCFVQFFTTEHCQTQTRENEEIQRRIPFQINPLILFLPLLNSQATTPLPLVRGITPPTPNPSPHQCGLAWSKYHRQPWLLLPWRGKPVWGTNWVCGGFQNASSLRSGGEREARDCGFQWSRTIQVGNLRFLLLSTFYVFLLLFWCPSFFPILRSPWAKRSAQSWKLAGWMPYSHVGESCDFFLQEKQDF